MFKDFLRWLKVLDEEKMNEEAQAVKKEENERVPEVEAEVVAEVNAEVKDDSASVEADVLDKACDEEDAGESKFNEVCEELGVPEAVKEEGEALPVVVPVSDDGKGKGTMVNVSRDTHNRLKLAKAGTNLKSFDALIRQAFGW